MKHPIRVVAVFMFAPLAAGCYRYVPVSEGGPFPEQGKEVRVELSSPQPLDLGTMTLNDITVIEGDVFRNDGNTLGVFSRWLHTSYGYKHPTDGAVFFVTSNEIRRLEVRQLQPFQTALAAAAVAGGTVLAFDLALRVFGGGGSPGEDDGELFRAGNP